MLSTQSGSTTFCVSCPVTVVKTNVTGANLQEKLQLGVLSLECSSSGQSGTLWSASPTNGVLLRNGLTSFIKLVPEKRLHSLIDILRSL